MSPASSRAGRSRPVLLAGLPRSGTTWLASLLTRPDPLEQLYEPDNEKLEPVAWYCKRDLHRFPFLEAADRAPSLEALWRLALSGRWPASSPVYRSLRWWFRRFGGPPVEAHIEEKTGLCYLRGRWNDVRPGTDPFSVAGHPLVERLVRRYLADAEGGSPRPPALVKSVHSPLALDWLDEKLDVRVLLLLRNPFAIYASHHRRRYPDGDRNVLAQERLARSLEDRGCRVARVRVPSPALSFGLQTLVVLRVLAEQIRTHADWIVVSHDRLCAEPEAEMERLLRRLPAPWSHRPVSDFARPDGDPSERRRQPVKWKRELTREECESLRRLIDRLDLGGFLARHVYSEAYDYTRT